MEIRNLIPGLPDELATECLIRMHFESFPNAILTCKNWKHIIGSSGYLRRRIVDGHSQSIAIMSLRDYHWDVETRKEKLLLKDSWSELTTGIWSELPSIPGSFNALPIDRNMNVVGLNLVIIGDRLPRSSQGSKNVFIYSFVSNAWRHGADMLDPLLASCCVSDSDRTLYVVGIFYNEQMKLMMSALAYDVVKDDWVKLPDMDTEDEMGGVQKVTFLSGKLNVFRQYASGKFVGNMLFSVQTFDPATMMWGTVCKYLLDVDNECLSNPKVAGLVGNVHVCKESAVAVIADEKCQKIADLPIDGCDVCKMLPWNKHLAVYTASIHRGTNILCLLDLESKMWSNFEVPRRSDSEIVHNVCTAEIWPSYCLL